MKNGIAQCPQCDDGKIHYSDETHHWTCDSCGYCINTPSLIQAIQQENRGKGYT